MSDPQFVVVVEAGLRKNAYGADIRRSEPMSSNAAHAFFEQVLEGQHPALFDAAPGTQLLQITDSQFVAVRAHQLMSDELTRITLSELIRVF